MRGYIEFGDEARMAWKEREHRTRRLYSGIRGAICAMDKPRWHTAWALAECTACAFAIFAVLSSFKASTPASVFTAILVSWPIFLLCIHRAARQLDQPTISCKIWNPRSPQMNTELLRKISGSSAN